LGQTLRGLARALEPVAITPELRSFRSALVDLARTLLSLSDAERERWHQLVKVTSSRIDSTLASARALAAGKPVRLPGSQHHRFAAVEGDGYAVYVSPAGDLWHRSDAEAFLGMLDRVAPDAVGAGLVLYRHSRYIVDGFRRAAAIAWILVFVAVWLSLRRFTDAALALVPVSVGLIWLLGAMGATGRSFDHANVVVLPIILGIGVDAGVHLMHRARESHTTLPTLLGRTGTAISLSAATTAVGFGALMLAEYGAMRSFGSLMLIGLGAVWLAALAVLPALLVITRRVGSGQDHRTGR
ncbi:MAG: MMPL family transporter, partial [Myxococcota bacterium]